MPFAARLRESLEIRGSQVPLEITRGDNLEQVLTRHLAAVEENFDGDLITSVLLLSEDGKSLSHGAGPKLPQSYRAAIDGSEIGPRAGSCGTAAYLGQAVYVADIATDSLWADYRHLALPHGLASCWSTPIRSTDGSILGTFAIYHRDVSIPAADEIAAIELITDAVANAIIWARGVQDLAPFTAPSARGTTPLSLVWDNDASPDIGRLLRALHRLESLTMQMDRHADSAGSEQSKSALRTAAAESRSLIGAVRDQIERYRRLGP